MHFLDLPDDIFIDIILFLEEEWPTERVTTLASLRLTCRRLLPLTIQPFFSSLSLKIEHRDLPRVITQAKIIGHHVRQVILDLWVDTEGEGWQEKADIQNRDTLLSALVKQLPNVRNLIIHTLSSPTIELPLFVQSLGTLSQVRHLQVVEIASKHLASVEPIRCPVSNGIVREIVNSSSDQLLSLVLDGKSDIQLETFNIIRTIPTNLQTLLFRESLGLDCLPALCEAVPWKCRNTLQYIGFYDCRGAHSGAIASGVGSGLWCTHLRTLDVCKSGDHGDAKVLPYPIPEGRENPVISAACFEHAFDWELQLLGRLRVQEVKLTLVPRREIIQALRNGSFPGMSKLIIGKPPMTSMMMRISSRPVRLDGSICRQTALP